MSEKLTGTTTDTAAGDIVSVSVPAEGPYGIILEADREGHAAVVKAFERMPNSKFGPIQKHGGVHYGDVLFKINDNMCDVIPFNEVLAIVRDRNLLKKVFRFMNAAEYYRRKEAKNTPKIAGMSLGVEKSNPFMSTIRQSRISEDASKTKFCEYEIACQFRVVSKKVQKEVVYRWSVWRRYNEFCELHKNLCAKLGWQMDGIDLPSANTFVFNKLAQEFVEQRRLDLNAYWQKVIVISRGMVVEFQKHHAQADIKSFLDVENAMSGEISSGPDLSSIEDTGPSRRSSLKVASGGAAAGGRGAARRGSTGSARQSSAAGGANFAFNDSTPGPAAAASASSGKAQPAGASSSMATVSESASTEPARTAAPAALPEEYRVFKKMLDMKLPEQAVRIKMQNEGYSDKEVDSFLRQWGGSVGGAGDAALPPAASASQVPAKPAPAKAAPAAAAPAPAAAKAAPVAPPPEGKLPPKATGARANLFADIARHRVE